MDAKVMSSTQRSMRVARRQRRMAGMSIMFTEMSSSTPARAGMGSQLTSGAMTKSMGRASRPEKTVPMRLRPPLVTTKALRVKEPQPGMPEVRPAAMLPRPWPMSSWLPSKRSPRMPASCLPMASDSTAPSRAMASAGMNRSRMEAMSKAGGRERGGTTLGMAPTRRTPCSWRPSRAETAEMMTRAARVAGKRREMRLKSRISRMVPPETSRHQMLRCVKLWMT